MKRYRNYLSHESEKSDYNLAMPCNGAGFIGGTMYMNKREIQKAFKNGDLEGVKNQCVRYGNILSVKDWEVMDVERYNGAWRLYKIEHHDIQWKIEMHNGEVTSIERNHGEHKLF